MDCKLLVKDYRSLYKRYKNGAKKRGYGFTLSEEKFLDLVTSKCSFCGTVPFQTHGKIQYMGIDRTDSSKDYTDDNCSPCCKHCNYAKGSMKFWEFDEWLERIAEFYPRKMKAYREDTVGTLLGKSAYYKAVDIMEKL